MKNDKHTPGPWFVHDGNDFDLCDENQVLALSDETGNYCIASVDNDERGQANAALIARAPLLIECREVIARLLKALDVAIDRADLENGDIFGIHHNDTMDAMDEARALLAKLDAE